MSIPFTLQYLVGGVAVIMTLRYTLSFLVDWLRLAIEMHYVEHLQWQTFDKALESRIGYFDTEGSDEILNAIVTQAENGGRVINFALGLIERSLLALVYAGIAFLLAPILTVLTVVFLGGLTVAFRYRIDSGYAAGDKVATAKENIQESAQYGTQGVRDVKLFGLENELRDNFKQSIRQYVKARIKIARNKSVLNNFYQLAMAVTVFTLIYVALTVTSLSFGELSVFLFAMFRLGPRMSAVNSFLYRVEGQLPHLVRTHDFIEELESQEKEDTGNQEIPDNISSVTFDEVCFSYNAEGEMILNNISFNINENEFVAFVGPSGTGKSTIVSLLARMYEPDTGTIKANQQPIYSYPLNEWRSNISVVRQDAYIFNDTLRRNITIGNRDATQEEIERVCEIAQVTEFIPDLPEGYETNLGDQGVKLSGGQRQRIAIARAMLKDADILILDEATSDLDTTLEQKVHTAIEKANRNYIMLVIAHRLSTVTNADRIYSMENGQIIERGTHSELMSQDGVYSDSYMFQAS